MTTIAPAPAVSTATTVTPATHPDLSDGVLIGEAFGLATVFVPSGDVDALIRDLASYRAAQPAVA